MKILIQMGHPAQFHFYKNAIARWEANGHKVRVLIRKKDVLESLLAVSGFDYVNMRKESQRKDTKLDLIKLASKRFIQLFTQYVRFRPDVTISLDPVLAKINNLFCKPFIAMCEDDYQVISLLANLLIPSSDCIFAPRVCDFSPWQDKKVEYEGFMKLAYLHPNQFTPDSSKINPFVDASKKYAIVRLVSLTAHHDKGIKGLNAEILDNIVLQLEKSGLQVFISSEIDVPPQYSAYRINIPVEQIHNLMAFASLIVCDSQSMAVEAAMLGVPSVRFNDFAGKISVLEELEHQYGLTFGIKTDNPEKLYKKIDELLAQPNMREEFQKRRQQMLSDKIDVTAFLVWFIENYPESKKIMKQTPDYQFNFK